MKYMAQSVTIVGASAVGLPLALELQKSDIQVRLIADKLPGEGVTADFSAGIGTPFCHKDPFVQDQYFQSYPDYMEMAEDPLCDPVMVSPIEFVVAPDEDLSWSSRVRNFEQRSDTLVHFDAYTIDPKRLNEQRLAKVLENGGTLEHRPLNAEEVASLLKGDSLPGSRYTVCAMGLNNRSLRPDFQLYGIRGLIVHFPRIEDPRSYMDQWLGQYFVSRTDAFLVAGTYEPHVETCSTDEREAIGRRIFEKMQGRLPEKLRYERRIRITAGYRPTSDLGLIREFGPQVAHVTGLSGQGLVTGPSFARYTASEVLKKL